MFTVVDQPCRSSVYNNLPDVVDADAALRPFRATLAKLVGSGTQVCQSTPFEDGAIGGFLLHRHWELNQDECIIERPGQHPSGRPALISSARPLDERAATAPSRFRVDVKRGELVPLEFSSDSSVRRIWRDLNASPDVLNRLCRTIGDSGLSDKIGLCILARDLPVADGELLVEENFDEASVLNVRTLAPIEEENAIETAWPFVAAGDAGAPRCIIVCFSAGSGPHSLEHFGINPTTLPQ